MPPPTTLPPPPPPPSTLLPPSSPPKPPPPPPSTLLPALHNFPVHLKWGTTPSHARRSRRPKPVTPGISPLCHVTASPLNNTNVAVSPLPPTKLKSKLGTPQANVMSQNRTVPKEVQDPKKAASPSVDAGEGGGAAVRRIETRKVAEKSNKEMMMTTKKKRRFSLLREVKDMEEDFSALSAQVRLKKPQKRSRPEHYADQAFPGLHYRTRGCR